MIVTDACRWDFAEAVKNKLASFSCTLTPIVSTLPTETEFGMIAMLPLGEESLTVEFGKAGLSIKQGNLNLTTRDGRKEFLKRAFTDPDGRTQIGFVDMEALLKGTKVPDTPLVVVFDNTIDEQGHKGDEQLPSLVEQFTGNLRRTVERLHGEGIGTVHVITDHGFLLLPPEEVDGQGTPEVKASQVYYKGPRWAALKKDVPVTELLRLPFPLAPQQVSLGLARGVRTLLKAQPYLHGGLSLQECILPHLESHSTLPRVQVGLDLKVKTTRLTGGTVPVILRPVLGGPQAPLGGVQPIKVRIWIATVSAPGKESQQVVEPVELEVRPDADELKPPVYLKEGLDLKTGQRLLLQAVEVGTGKDLGRIELTLAVDWD